MSLLSDYFFKSSSSIVQLELLEISHPAFSKTYRIVRNALDGITVTIDGVPTVFDYYPVRITSEGLKADLDSSFKIEFGDLGEVLPLEIDRVNAAGGFSTKPSVRYWTFRSDNLTTPLEGPITFEIHDVTFNLDGASFKAKAPALNSNRTGEVYSFERFPMLKGFM